MSVDPLEVQDQLDPKALKVRGDNLAHWEIQDLLGQLAPVARWVHLEIEDLAVPKETQEALEVLDLGVT